MVRVQCTPSHEQKLGTKDFSVAGELGKEQQGLTHPGTTIGLTEYELAKETRSKGFFF